MKLYSYKSVCSTLSVSIQQKNPLYSEDVFHQLELAEGGEWHSILLCSSLLHSAVTSIHIKEHQVKNICETSENKVNAYRALNEIIWKTNLFSRKCPRYPNKTIAWGSINRISYLSFPSPLVFLLQPFPNYISSKTLNFKFYLLHLYTAKPAREDFWFTAKIQKQSKSWALIINNKMSMVLNCYIKA